MCYTMVDWEVYYSKVKHNAKQTALLHFLVIMWPVRLITYCWPVYYSQPLEQTLIVAILQSLDGKDNG